MEVQVLNVIRICLYYIKYMLTRLEVVTFSAFIDMG